MSEEKDKTQEKKESSEKKDVVVEIDKKESDQGSRQSGGQAAISDQKKNKKEEKEDKKTVAVKGKKKKKAAPFLRGGRGQAHIKSSYNNTIITITDLNGAVLIGSSAGKCGFKGSRKSTPYAAGIIIKSITDKVKELGIKELDVFVKGVGTGREAAIRAFDANGLKIVSIKDVTPIQHGGCRPKKRRRV